MRQKRSRRLPILVEKGLVEKRMQRWRLVLAGLVASCCLWRSSPVGGQERPEFLLQAGHTDMVLSLAFSPDGKILASGSGDDTLKLWEVATGTLLRTLEGHLNQVNSLAFSPDGKMVASGGEDFTLKLWEVATGKLLRSLEHRNRVRSVAFSPDGKTVAAAVWDDTLRLWEVATGKLLRTFKGHSTNVETLAFSPDGKTLASGSWDQTVRVWEAATGTLLHTLQGHAHNVEGVAFSPDGRTLLSGSADGVLKLWQVANGRLLRTFEGHAENIGSVAFSPDGKTLVSGSWDHTSKLWEVTTGRLLRTFEGHSHHVDAVAFSPDGRTLASGSWDDTMKLWDVGTGRLLHTFDEGQSRSVSSVALSPDGETLVSGGEDQMLRVWDVATGSLLRTLEGHFKNVFSVAFSPDGSTLASGGGNNTLLLWEVATGRVLRTLVDNSYGSTFGVQAVAFSSDGRTLVSGNGDGTLKVWEVAKGRLVRILVEHPNGIRSITISPDGKTVVSGGWDKTLRVWNVATGRLLDTLEPHSGAIVSVAFSPDGKTLISGGGDGGLTLWDVATATSRRALEKHADGVSSIVFSSDGKTLVSGSWDRTLKVWEAATGRLLRTFEGHSNRIKSVAIAPNGKTLVSGSEDSSVRYWRLADGDLLATSHAFHGDDFLTYTPEGLYVASPGGERMASWRVEGEVYGFAQYADRFYRPDLVRQRIAGRPVEVPGRLRIGKDRPPTLRWLEPFSSTRESQVRLWLDFDGSTELDHLIVVFNNELLPIEVSEDGGRLEIPLRLSARQNRLVVIAIDRQRLKSKPLEVGFEYLGGAEANPVEIALVEPLPDIFLDADDLRLNQHRIEILRPTSDQPALRFLGPAGLVKEGVNWLETQDRRFRFWWEEQKLLQMPDPYRQSYAILVAIDDYAREKDPGLGPTGLESLDDMKARAEELEAALIGVGFDARNITTLYDRDATSTRINRELERFWDGEDRADANRVFFYFGGHGRGTDGRGYLVTYDFDPNRPARTSFLMSDIVGRHFLHTSAHHMFVALDACSSGLAIPGLRALSGGEEQRLQQFRQLTVILGDTQDVARNLLVAGTANEQALYDNGGIFTQALIDGLRRSADWNQDGVIQFEELALHVKNQVRDQALQTGVEQVPAFYSADAIGKGRVLFLTPP